MKDDSTLRTAHRYGVIMGVAFWVGLVALVCLLVSCNPCRQAQKHIAKAAVLCPETLRPDAPDSATGEASWTQAQVDSILAGCEQLEEALASEHALSVIAVKHLLQRDTLTTPVPKRVLKKLRKPSPARSVATTQLRRALCTIDPVFVNTEDLSLHIWVDAISNTIKYTAECRGKSHVVLDPELGRPAFPLWLIALMVALLIAIIWHIARQVWRGLNESHFQG